MEIAQTIYNQLGCKAFYMIGAKDFVATKKGLMFRVGRNAVKANKIIIELNSMDLYDIRFISVRGCDFTVKKEFKGVYASDLHRILESTLQLRLSLERTYA